MRFVTVIAVFFLLLVYTYWDLPKTFFQQDEWQFFGSAIWALSSSNPILSTALPLQGQLTHFYPLSTLFFLLQYIIFNVNFTGFVLVSLLLHFTNVILVYLLLRKIVKNELIAFVSSALFLVYSVSHQATTWVLAATFTLPSTLFLLLSLIFFVNFLEKDNQKYFYASVLLLGISLFFKEVSVFLPLFYLAFLLLFTFFKRKDFGIFKKHYLVLIMVGLVYFLIRIFFLFVSVRSPQSEIGDVTTAPLASYFLRLLTVPFKGLSQSFFPQEFILELSDKFIYLAYPQFTDINGFVNQYIAQSIGFDAVAYFLSAVVLAVSFLGFGYLNKRKEKRLGYLVPICLLFIIISLLPFIFVPGKAGYFSIFEPRNLYIPAVGASLIISILFYCLAGMIGRKGVIIKYLFFILIGFTLLLHVQAVRRDLGDLRAIGTLRRSFLETLQRDYPNLPKKVIIYTQSDRSYYGMPEQEKILPIQSGFGRMVMVWYQTKENFPACLYENQFLHDLLSQGFKFCDSRGFGYFRDYALLLEALKENKLSTDNVLAYQWNGDINEFLNTTAKVREEFKKDLSR